MILAGTINPYRQSIPFPYGMSTGDNLYGTFLQGSYYNLVLSAMLAIYFLFRREMIYSLLACTCLVLIFGNFGTIVFTCLLAGLLFLGLINDITGRKVKLFRNLSPPPYYPVKIAGIVMYTIFLYIVVSPGNAKYISDKVKEKVYSVETGGKDDYRAIIANQKMDPMAFDMFNDKYLDEKMQNYSKETSLYFKAGTAQSEAAKGDEALKIRKEMTRNYIQMLQGKSLAVLETIEHLKSSSKVLLIGAGTGHFSSLTAQKIAGFDSSRLFMNILPHYISPEYANNHYLLIEERLKSSKELYSTANWPDSFYNQIASEYGLTGVLLFIIFYVGFFLKKINKLTYGFWIIILLIPFAHLSYIFDTICVMPYFELLLLLDIEDGKQRYAAAKV